MSTTHLSVDPDYNTDMTQHPQRLDEQLYPFLSHCVEVDVNRIHYIEEGSGPTLLLLHPGVG